MFIPVQDSFFLGITLDLNSLGCSPSAYFIDQLPGFPVLTVDMGFFNCSYFVFQVLLGNYAVGLLQLFLGLFLLMPVVSNEYNSHHYDNS